MARAGGDDSSPPPQPSLHTFTIPLPRIPLQPGQRVTLRIVPGVRPGEGRGMGEGKEIYQLTLIALLT